MGQNAVSSASVKPITSVMIATFCARRSVRSSSAYALRLSVFVSRSPASGVWAYAETLPAATSRATAVVRRTTFVPPLLLLLRWIVLENLLDGLVDALVALLGIGLRIDFLDAHSAPRQLVLLRVRHVDDEGADQDVAHLRRCRSAGPSAAPSPPVGPVPAAVAGAVGRDVLLLVERHVIHDEHVRV